MGTAGKRQRRGPAGRQGLLTVVREAKGRWAVDLLVARRRLRSAETFAHERGARAAAWALATDLDCRILDDDRDRPVSGLSPEAEAAGPEAIMFGKFYLLDGF